VDEMTSGYQPVIDEICDMRWSGLSREQLSAVAQAYYYFSIQFRKNLECALGMHPDDAQLKCLVSEECATDNLSPWPGVAALNEKMNHDEFMRRVLNLSPIHPEVEAKIEAAGRLYLSKTGQVDDNIKAIGIASYEAGGLESVFKSILKAPHWDTPFLEAFQHFLVMHIGFDSDPNEGHGALVGHLVLDDRVRCLWVAFRDLLVAAVPELMD
jgi:hypothetical protein